MLKILYTNVRVCDGEDCDAYAVPAGYIRPHRASSLLSDSVHANEAAAGWTLGVKITVDGWIDLCPTCAEKRRAREKQAQAAGTDLEPTPWELEAATVSDGALRFEWIACLERLVQQIETVRDRCRKYDRGGEDDMCRAYGLAAHWLDQALYGQVAGEVDGDGA